MEATGVPVSRWFDLVLESKDNIDQPDNLRAMVFWGHAANSQTRLADMKKAMEKLDLLVIIDPYPTVAAVVNDRQNGTYLRSEEHTSELQSLMRISYAVFCLKQKSITTNTKSQPY